MAVDESARETGLDRFRDHYLSHAPSVFAWGLSKLKRVGRPDLAEDLTQKVFGRALTSLDRLRGGDEAFRPWVFGFARNVLRELLHEIARTGGDPTFVRRSVSLDEMPSEITSVSRRLARDEEIRLFVEWMQSLDEASSRLLELHGLEQLTFKDVSVELGISVSAARKRWQRLMSRLPSLGLPRSLGIPRW